MSTKLVSVTVNNDYRSLVCTPEVAAKLLPLLALCEASGNEWSRNGGSTRVMLEANVKLEFLSERPISQKEWLAIKEAEDAEANTEANPEDE